MQPARGPSAEGHFGNQGPGGKAICLCWLGVQFNRRDLFQTSSSTILEDTQGEPQPGDDGSKRTLGFPSCVEEPRDSSGRTHLVVDRRR